MATETVSEDWHNLFYDSRPTSPSTDTVSRSGPTSNSSIAESPDCENIPQAPAPDEIANSTLAVLQNGSATYNGCEEEPKFPCMHHTHPENDRPTYTAMKDLRRHQKEHDPEAILWHCGCCQNLGDKFEPKVRKDKVQTHLRNIHEKPKSELNKAIHCPAEGCHTLLTATSCLEEHWRQKHAGQLQETSSQKITDSKCLCKQEAESKRRRESLQSGSSKRGATSHSESKTKQRRLEPAEHQTQCLGLVPQAMDLHKSSVSTSNSLENRPSTDLSSSAFNNFPLYPMNDERHISYSNNDPLSPLNEWARHPTITVPLSNGAANMNHGASMPSDLAPMNFLYTSSRAPYFQLCLEDSKPADFLAIRKTQDFQNLARILRQTSNEYLYQPINAITYNPKKEILTLTADSHSRVEKAMTVLRLLVDNFSATRGRKYLETSHPSTSRALLLDSSGAHSGTSSRTTRSFPMIPKEHPRLVQTWYKSILPALSKILCEKLGGIFSVSLIRQGQTVLGAEPCIQIGSPCIPGRAAQIVIKDLVGKLWEMYELGRIPMRFIEGGIKRLNGGNGADDDDSGESDDGGESAVSQRLDFNYNRPYSQAVMGASIGLLCSGTTSATLGGFVLIGGEKYLLTSEHFVAYARAQADKTGDLDTLISPSRQDLEKIESNLKQDQRDIETEIKSLEESCYGDRDVPESDFSDPNLPHELRDAGRRYEDIISLLDQVTRDHLDYAIGTVKKLSLGTLRRHSISRSMTNSLGLQNDEREASHLVDWMDWALITTNSHTAQAGENRHKYRSSKDAIEEVLYVDESNRASQSGDVVYETCAAEAGHEVYYVGRRSKHRYGHVNVPSYDSTSKSSSWEIIALDGQDIPDSDVAGDSGAWVIRKADNKLMGQVHSVNLGRVLFTAIDAIFAELEKICQTTVSLPPRPPGSHYIASTIPPRRLCSGPQTRIPRGYKFNIPAREEPITAPRISPIKITIPKARPFESSSAMTIVRTTNTTLSQRSFSSQCDSPSSLPTLIDSPLSSATTPEYPKSPQLSGDFDFAGEQVNIERLPSVSPPTIIGESTASEIPDLSLDKPEEDQSVKSKPITIQFKFQSPPGTILSTRTSTWPVTLRKSQGTKARPGSRFSHLRMFRKHAVPYSARAVLDKFARSTRQIEDVTDIETLPSPSKNDFATLPTLSDVCKRDYALIPEDCNVAA